MTLSLIWIVNIAENWERGGVQEEISGYIYRPENLQRLSTQVNLLIAVLTENVFTLPKKETLQNLLIRRKYWTYFSKYLKGALSKKLSRLIQSLYTVQVWERGNVYSVELNSEECNTTGLPGSVCEGRATRGR